MLDEMFQQKKLKFAIFLKYKTHMANFEKFWWNISSTSSINLLFQVQICIIGFTLQLTVTPTTTKSFYSPKLLSLHFEMSFKICHRNVHY